MGDEQPVERVAMSSAVGMGVGLVTGAAAALLLGGVGAALWLWWLWSKTPPSVRTAVPVRRQIAAVGLVLGSAALGLVGLFGTVIGVVHAFGSVAAVDPSQKARQLADRTGK